MVGMQPEQIEALSFSIIDSEAGAHGFPADQWRIVQRMIHTSADFDYLQSVRFHPRAIEAGVAAIRSGCTIVTDTHMARAGIRKTELARFGVAATCYIGDPDVRQRAAQSGSTRARAAVDAAVNHMAGGIFVVGNAPTALLRLLELVRAGAARPALVVGLPVGFVNAAESKAALVQTDIPYISNVGRKGGSNVAASVVNALTKLALERDAEA
jgi:precorrin-8X/cobalt-precorrin-8 methylmutase